MHGSRHCPAPSALTLVDPPYGPSYIGYRIVKKRVSVQMKENRTTARRPRPAQHLAWVATALLCVAGAASAGDSIDIETGTDEQARLPYWELANGAMSLRLVQRLPDQTRAFFMARGFDADETEIIARTCVFQTVFKNTSHESEPSALRYDLREWRVRRNGETGGLKTREDWARVWEGTDTSRAARIALEWALLPTRQSYEAGDYNWGMSMVDVPAGENIDLTVVWRQHGREHRATIEDLQCAPDVPSKPGQQ